MPNTKPLTAFERSVLLDALRKAIRDPAACASINKTRENLIDLINNGGMSK